MPSLQEIFNELTKLTFFSDACPSGWRASCNSNSTGGYWTPEEFSFHVTLLEIASTFYTLKTCKRNVSNFQIPLKVEHHL